MSNEWKEIEIDDLEPDILTDKYEFADYDTPTDTFVIVTIDHIDCLRNIVTTEGDFIYYYRLFVPEPKQPTHENIMTPRFWQMDNEDYWRTITGVRKDKSSGYIFYLINDGWCEPGFFRDRKSSDLLDLSI